MHPTLQHNAVAIELAQLPPRPRRVVRRRELGRYFGPARAATLFLAILGVLMTLPLAALVIVAKHGHVATATFVSRAHTGSGRNAHTRVYYTYLLDGKTIESSDEVAPGTYADTVPSTLIDVRWLRFGGYTLDQLPKSAVEALLVQGHYALVTLCVCGIAVGLIWHYFVRPNRYRRLLRSGIGAVGQLSDRQAVEIKDDDRWGSHDPDRPAYERRYRYYLAYRFHDRAGEPHKGRMRVAVEDFDRVEIGEPLLVLYDAHRPDRNVIYPFGDDLIVTPA